MAELRLNENVMMHVIQSNPDWARLDRRLKELPQELKVKKEELKTWK